MVFKDSNKPFARYISNPFTSFTCYREYDVQATTTLSSSPSSVINKDEHCKTLVKLPRQPRKKKVVRIVEEHNTFLERPLPWFVSDVSHQWYSREELLVMRQNRVALIDEIITQDQQSKSRVTFQTVLLQAYRDCCEHQPNKHDAQDDDDSSKQQQEEICSPSFFPFLSRMLEMCPSRTGMESLGVPLVAIRQQVRRNEMKKSIRYMQQQGHVMGGERLEECIRRVSESCSRPSCLYAGLIARAHAEATRQVML